MNRKHNPMVALVALLLLAMLLLCAGCSAPAAAAPEEPEAEVPETSLRFMVERQFVKDEAIIGGIQNITIITDTETGAQYLWMHEGYAGGLTVLQPAPEEVTES